MPLISYVWVVGAYDVKDKLRGSHGGDDFICHVSEFHDIYKGVVVVGEMLHDVLLKAGYGCQVALVLQGVRGGGGRRREGERERGREGEGRRREGEGGGMEGKEREGWKEERGREREGQKEERGREGGMEGREGEREGWKEERGREGGMEERGIENESTTPNLVPLPLSQPTQY